MELKYDSVSLKRKGSSSAKVKNVWLALTLLRPQLAVAKKCAIKSHNEGNIFIGETEASDDSSSEDASRPEWSEKNYDFCVETKVTGEKN